MLFKTKEVRPATLVPSMSFDVFQARRASEHERLVSAHMDFQMVFWSWFCEAIPALVFRASH